MRGPPARRHVTPGARARRPAAGGQGIRSLARAARAGTQVRPRVRYARRQRAADPLIARVTPSALLQLRLHNQHLLAPCRTPLDVVRSLGAVQSQDFPSACWAVGQRATSVVQADVLRAFDEGTIVRTHVLRPTWHFVDPADLRWMLRLTGPRVQAIAAAYYRNKGLDARMLARSRTVLAKE